VASTRQCEQIVQNFALWLIFSWAFSIFNLSKEFQNIICDTWFNNQKQFDATITLSFDYLATVLATFLKFGRFFQISGHAGTRLVYIVSR